MIYLLKKKKIKLFLNNLDHDEVFIGGCCGYGIKEMQLFIDDLKKIDFIKFK